LPIVLSVLRFTTSYYSYVIFKLFFHVLSNIIVRITNQHERKWH
jgi:hypothetical protein